MLTRFLVLVLVSGISGAIGIGLGFLLAPAPGAEAREAVTAFFDSHEDLLTELYSRGSDAFESAVSAMSAGSDGKQD